MDLWILTEKCSRREKIMVNNKIHSRRQNLRFFSNSVNSWFLSSPNILLGLDENRGQIVQKWRQSFKKYREIHCEFIVPIHAHILLNIFIHKEIR